MTIKICTECNREFVPSSRHLKCPTCRSKTVRDTCSCGNPMAKGAKTCKSCLDVSGINNGNYRTGTTKHNKGYVMVSCPDHPRVQNLKTTYVFEHILVMEETLGRHLLPNENVHHKNGIKDDNRPENLELWAKAQPAGQRVEDLLAFAYEIIERYGPTPTSIND